MSRNSVPNSAQLKKTRRSRLRRSSWSPAVIFVILTILTIFMALALKALINGSVHF